MITFFPHIHCVLSPQVTVSKEHEAHYGRPTLLWAQRRVVNGMDHGTQPIAKHTAHYPY